MSVQLRVQPSWSNLYLLLGGGAIVLLAVGLCAERIGVVTSAAKTERAGVCSPALREGGAAPVPGAGELLTCLGPGRADMVTSRAQG